MTKWEYKVVDLVKEIGKEETRVEGFRPWLRAMDLEEVLNKLGAKGWELVDMSFLLDKGETVVVGLFKRPI